MKFLFSGVFIINFEQNLHIILVFPLLTLKKEIPAVLAFPFWLW